MRTSSRTSSQPASQPSTRTAGWERRLTELIEARRFVDAVLLVEPLVPRLLRDGSWEVLQATVQAVPPDDWSALMHVGNAEAALFTGHCSRELLDCAREKAAGDTELCWSLGATEAEWHLSRMDVVLACAMAAQTLAEMPDDLVAPAQLLRTRARCRRLVAIGMMGVGTTDAKIQADELRAGALTDLRRAELEEELAITNVMFATFEIVIFWDGVDSAINRVREARDLLVARRSRWQQSAELALAVCSLFSGDMAAFRVALDSIDSTEQIMMPLASLMIPYLCGIRDLIAGAASSEAVAAFDPILAAVRESYPPLVGPMFTHIASICADFGETDAAAEWVDRLGTTLPATPSESLERKALQRRIEIQRGRVEAIAEAMDILEQLRDQGLGRYAGVHALRTARDCERCAENTQAARFRAFGLDLIPPPTRRTLWEHLWSMPLLAPPADLTETIRPAQRQHSECQRGFDIRILAPELSITDASTGERVSVPPGEARLLVLLLALGQVTIDRAADLLWPEIDLPKGRNRINTVLHRLRRTLAVSTHEFLLRRGDSLIAEVPTGWTLDLHDFQRLVSGDVDEQVRAVQMITGALCSTQFAYDDALVACRRMFVQVWCDVAAQLIAQERVSVASLAPAMQELGIDPIELT